jgi:hypothetical protein
LRTAGIKPDDQEIGTHSPAAVAGRLAAVIAARLPCIGLDRSGGVEEASEGCPWEKSFAPFYRYRIIFRNMMRKLKIFIKIT